ncbi:hypothetical protein QYE76_008066 [Lolium multiflorum]|uniref:Retrotransposon gag domain-containing protein n=1 Tax=Lolium multiflorum TaxID=4521 RepID=A0AAD8VDU5_LOLMU|nr:hypothetical protein QYE76_008066 [Lolium multiflorum]
MSRVSLQDSINPKPLSEGIAEEHPRQLAPSVGTLSAQDRSSVDPVMTPATSSATSSTPSSPNLGSPIRFGSYEFTPHSDSSRSTFLDLQGNMEMTFGNVHYNVNAEGILRLLESPTSRSTSPSASSSLDLSAGLTGSTSSPALDSPFRVFHVGMPRPKTVAGATTNLAAYLINQRPEGSMAQAHRGALESLAILGNNVVPQKEKTTAHASGSKHHARDARDEITQSRIDKARRRRAARKDNNSDSSDEDQEYDGELRGADCLSYKIRETMPPKKFKPTPTDAAKYDGQQEPRSWIDDYLQTVILHKGNRIAAMKCLQLYLKDSARAWLRRLPKGSIKSWDDLVDAFVANFQATYRRPVGIEELQNCQQKQKESMRSYIGRFTKLLNAAEDVRRDEQSTHRDGVRRESYIEELGRKKPKTITKLMEIANSWADGEDNVRRPRRCSDDEDDDQLKHDSGGRRDRHKRRKNRNYDDNNLVAAWYSDRQDDRYDERRDDRQDGNRNNSGTVATINHGERTPELPYAEQINAPVTCTRMSTPRTEKRSRVTCSGTVGSSLTCTNSSSSQASNSYHHHPHLHRSIKSSRLNLINPTRRFHHHVGR